MEGQDIWYWKAYREGLRAKEQGAPKNNPHNVGTTQREGWAEGYADGVAIDG